MKKFAVIMCSALLSAACSSIGDTPYVYTKEINDAVKFYVAEAGYFIEAANSLPKEYGNGVISLQTYDELCEYDMEMMNVYNDIYMSDNDITYKQVLTTVSKDDESPYAEAAAIILRKYDEMKIDLSKYNHNDVKSGYENWLFEEKNTGITFIFELATESGNKVWSCYPDDDSYLDYINSNVEWVEDEE